MGFVRNLTGKTAANAAKEGGKIQSAAGAEANALLNPLAFGDPNQARQSGLAELNAQIESIGGQGTNQAGGGFGGIISHVTGKADQSRLADLIAQRDQLQSSPLGPVGLGQQGLNQAGFLTDPNAQFDFLQNNPLFQLGLDNANEQTLNLAAARGRLSAGDTLQQLNQNALLTASPLIQQQKQSIGDLISIGERTAANQGNLLTGSAAAEAGGIVGAANARGAGASNIFGGVLSLGSALGAAALAPPPLPVKAPGV